MPSERARAHFADILAACDRIQQWTHQAGGPATAAMADSMIRSAIERQLLVISEAAIRLDKLDPALAPALAPHIDWAGVRGIGNVLRHRYDDLDEALILDVLVKRLPDLREATFTALTRLAP